MKSSVIGKIILATALSVYAFNAFAANNAGPKPKCRMGQIPVLEDGAWKCKQPSIKAPTNPSATKAKPTRKPGVSPTMPNTIQAQKADYIIMSISRVGGTNNKFGVQIKNQGKVGAHGGQLSGANMGSDGGSASTPMPSLKAGEFKHVFITFNNSKFNRGDRIRFHADSSNAIKESNEKNNKKFYNYQ